MEPLINCPHCQHRLRRTAVPQAAALMCPFCRNLFTFSTDTAGLPAGRTPRHRPAGPPQAPGTHGSQAYPYYLPAMPRPFGVSLIGGLGIISCGLLSLMLIIVEATILAAACSPAVGRELDRIVQVEGPENVSLPSLGIGMAIILAVALIGLWASVRLRQKRESARRILSGMGLFGIFLALLQGIYAVGADEGTVPIGKLLFPAALLIYCAAIVAYLQRPTIKNWFTD
ncbi:MAG: hypothetical protein JW810_12410 [Sedimentisphaerales bacterium]|nr:hypothetical protein [Sedimentisphaerales bacterium]